MRRIVFISQKGGTGKTASSVHTAAAIGKLGHKVLLFDMDPQGNATTWLNSESKSDSLKRFLLDGEPLENVVHQTGFDNLFIVAGGAPSGEAQRKIQATNGGVLLLKNKLGSPEGYDFIIFDCPSGVGDLVISSLLAAKEVVVPVEFRYLAMKGVDQMLQIVAEIKQSIAPNIVLRGILPTRLNKVPTEGRLIMDDIQSIPEDIRFETIIPQSEQLSLSSRYHKPVMYFNSQCEAGQAYTRFADELIKRA